MYFTDENNTRRKVCCEQQHFNIDYKNTDITKFSIINVLNGRSENLSTNMRKLETNANSRIMIYINSHGGDEFLRIRWKSVMFHEEINRTLWEMYEKKRYKEILLVIDGCKVFSLNEYITAPNIYFVGSTLKTQLGYSYLFDNVLLTQLSDKFTFKFAELLEKKLEFPEKVTNLDDFFEVLNDFAFLNANVGVRNGLNRQVINFLM